jgi:hypothetical protein
MKDRSPNNDQPPIVHDRLVSKNNARFLCGQYASKHGRCRSNILAQLAKGRSNKWITKNCHHGRELIREVRADPSEIYWLHHAIGAPKKIIPDVTRQVD